MERIPGMDIARQRARILPRVMPRCGERLGFTHSFRETDLPDLASCVLDTIRYCEELDLEEAYLRERGEISRTYAQRQTRRLLDLARRVLRALTFRSDHEPVIRMSRR